MIVGYELKLRDLMGIHFGMIMDCKKFSGKKETTEKMVETGSEVIFDSVNEFTGGLLKHFDEKRLSNSSKRKSCL